MTLRNFTLYLISVYILIGLQLCTAIAAQAIPDWTWLHAITFSKHEQLKNGRKHELIFKKEQIDSFSQLVLSWNAFRPDTGYLSFDVQVRDKNSGLWSQWWRMHEWGKNIQRSYYGPSDGIAQVDHVRLELKKGRVADAFSVRIRANKGASLASIAGCYASVSNMEGFVPEADRLGEAEYASVAVSGIPHYCQFAVDHIDNNRICSPTSCSMMCNYATKELVIPIDFAQHVYDEGLNTYGSWPYNIAHLFDACKGVSRFYVSRLHSFAQLYEQLSRNMPVVVSIRGPLAGAPLPYLNGHLVVVVGYDRTQQAVICHDPAVVSQESVLQRYPRDSFVRAWERSHRLAYVMDLDKK